MEVLGAQNSAETPDSLGWKRSYALFVSADGTQTSQVGNQDRPPHSEPQPDSSLGSRGLGLGGRVPYGSRGVANPNEFGQDPTQFGQLVYDPPPDYPSTVGIPPLGSLPGSENREDLSSCMLPQEGASLHGMLHASRQWLGEVSQPSETPPQCFPQIPFSAM